MSWINSRYPLATTWPTAGTVVSIQDWISKPATRADPFTAPATSRGGRPADNHEGHCRSDSLPARGRWLRRWWWIRCVLLPLASEFGSEITVLECFLAWAAMGHSIALRLGRGGANTPPRLHFLSHRFRRRTDGSFDTTMREYPRISVSLMRKFPFVSRAPGRVRSFSLHGTLSTTERVLS
jgi:hypothetical protein